MKKEEVLNFFRLLFPERLFKFLQPYYHYTLAFFAALRYSFPSRDLNVIGVTGTNGKSTVVEMLRVIFETAGYDVASISSIRFQIKERVWKNTLKMTMPGRFQLQRFLNDARNEKVGMVIIEVTSEGIRQFRHKFIQFETAVLTNITPEHIESHGSFQKYRNAKLELFKAAKTHVLNADDENISFFRQIPSKKKVEYSLNEYSEDINLKLGGEFNKYNALASVCTASLFDIDKNIIYKALSTIEYIPGRLESVIKKPFSVFVDYAHTPNALINAYKTVKPAKKSSRLICVLGSCGGGRDRWKREELGSIADKYCDVIILTNEDPYDEPPEEIINEIKIGIIKNKADVVLNRRLAISKALNVASNGDTVIITGKGCEPWIVVERGHKIPWDDRVIVREEYKKLYNK